MKILLRWNLYFVIFVLFSTMTFNLWAANKREYGAGGCGFGAMTMGKDGNQVLAITTNATGTQTFAISSGTSNCVPDKRTMKRRSAEVDYDRSEQLKGFVEGNKMALLNDLARGDGEIIWTISKVYECKNSLLVGRELQKNYKKIVSRVDIDANELSSNIDSVITKSDILSNSCTIF
ncbi:MAG: DUF3015 family protein [Oligoflexia bacterium]|nr:DUF3015 family protein [Oligoflexia bacterium]